MKSSSRIGPATARDIREAMFGNPVAGMRVLRQAWRVTDDDSDELVVIESRGEWWLARRLSDRLTVWAYPGEDETIDAFDGLLREDRERGNVWREAQQPLAS